MERRLQLQNSFTICHFPRLCSKGSNEEWCTQPDSAKRAEKGTRNLNCQGEGVLLSYCTDMLVCSKKTMDSFNESAHHCRGSTAQSTERSESKCKSANNSLLTDNLTRQYLFFHFCYINISIHFYRDLLNYYGQINRSLRGFVKPGSGGTHLESQSLVVKGYTDL